MPTPIELDAPNCVYPVSAGDAMPFPAVAGERQAEVLVVGGGYTGLWTALHLAERRCSVTLLEAREPGFGAAGRNGGQVNAGLKYEPDRAEHGLGPVLGPRLVSMALSAPQFLFATIERLGIECEACHSGTLRVAGSPRHVQALEASAEQWHRRGVPVERWSRDRVAAATGTTRYLAGLFDPAGGSVNPLALARGIAAAARRAGATIHGSSPVMSLTPRGQGWLARTPHGAVVAERVVVATDGYTGGLVPGLAQSVVPIFSAMVATAPLPDELAGRILPRREVVYETGNITVYYRRDASNRLLMGGRGPQRKALNLRDYRHLVNYARRLWPALAHLDWTHWWNGQFAITSDYYPRLHMPQPGLFVMLGYSGRGVALSSVLGAELSSLLTGAPVESFPLPITPIRRMPLHRFWRVGVELRVAYGRLRDRLDG